MKAKQVNRTLLALEAHTGLGPTFVARLLGLPYISYAQYRSGERSLKTTHVYHCEVLMLLDQKALSKRIKEVVYADE